MPSLKMCELATKATSFIFDEFERKGKWDRGLKSRKRIHFIHFKLRYRWYYWICRVTRKFRLINWLSDWNSKTWNKKKQQKGRFLGSMMGLMAASLIAPMASSLIKPVVSSLINYISGTGKGQKGGFLLLLAFSGEKS